MSIRASFQQQAKRYAERGARNIMAAAGIGLIAATAVVAPGYAQQATPIAATSEITADTKCKDYKPGQFGQSAICEIKKGVVLDQELARIEQTNACLRKIKSALDAGTITRDRLGQVSKQNACAIAAGLS